VKNWKNWLVPGLFALAGVGFLIPAVLRPAIDGTTLDGSSLVFALVYLTLAVVFFSRSRDSGGGSGPPSA
jgi:hypothetical protein